MTFNIDYYNLYNNPPTASLVIYISSYPAHPQRITVKYICILFNLKKLKHTVPITRSTSINSGLSPPGLLGTWLKPCKMDRTGQLATQN